MENDKQKKTDLVQEILAKDAARVKRMKMVMIITWLIFAVLFIIGGVVEHLMNAGSALNPSIPVPGFHPTPTTPEGTWIPWVPIIAITLRAFLLIAIIFTVSFYIRSKTLSMRQIQVRLSAIEEAIKKIDTKGQ